MIDLYSWPTPNGHKIHILLEELELDYQVYAIDIGAGDQFHPAFLKISPNNKIPAIVDRSGQKPVPVFESGAILIYLAEQHQRFFGTNPTERLIILQWLMLQMGGVGPMLGQAHHFRIYAPQTIEYAIERYTREATRLYGVLDRQLAQKDYLAGPYSIADIATFPWIRSHERQGQDLNLFPNLKAWFQRIEQRPAVQRGLKVLDDKRKPFSAQELETLFGSTPK